MPYTSTQLRPGLLLSFLLLFLLQVHAQRDSFPTTTQIRDFMKEHNRQREKEGLEPLDIRIGIHVGPVVAGVVGTRKYAYDIWGSTVNIASRMESNGAPGEVNISAATYELVKERWICRHRGKVYAKNVGDIDMYFVQEEIGMTPGLIPVAVPGTPQNDTVPSD